MAMHFHPTPRFWGWLFAASFSGAFYSIVWRTLA